MRRTRTWMAKRSAARLRVTIRRDAVQPGPWLQTTMAAWE